MAGGVATPAATTAAALPVTGATASPVATPPAAAVMVTVRPTATAAPVRVRVSRPSSRRFPAPSLLRARPPPAPPAPAPPPADHLVGPGTDAPAFADCPVRSSGFSSPLPVDRVVIHPCAQPVTGVPLIVGHNLLGLLWNATVSWGDGTVVQYGGRSWARHPADPGGGPLDHLLPDATRRSRPADPHLPARRPARSGCGTWWRCRRREPLGEPVRVRQGGSDNSVRAVGAARSKASYPVLKDPDRRRGPMSVDVRDTEARRDQWRRELLRPRSERPRSSARRGAPPGADLPGPGEDDSLLSGRARVSPVRGDGEPRLPRLDPPLPRHRHGNLLAFFDFPGLGLEEAPRRSAGAAHRDLRRPRLRGDQGAGGRPGLPISGRIGG